jgi:hypothetical protein
MLELVSIEPGVVTDSRCQRQDQSQGEDHQTCYDHQPALKLFVINASTPA